MTINQNGTVTTLKNKIIIITIFYLFTKPLNKMATKIQKVLK